MNGTEKQVIWAETIRAEYDAAFVKFSKMASVNAAAAEAVNAVREAYDAVINPDHAACWIDLRNYLTEGSIKAAIADQMSGKELWIATAAKTWIAGNHPFWAKR